MYMEFKHNFCESRLNNFNPPEMWNSFSSLAISIIPFLYTTPTNNLLFNIKYLLVFNGFASFLYHYNLNWFGKQLDEISMILCNFFGLSYLINIYLLNCNYSKSIKDMIKLANIYFCVFFLTINTFIKLDFLFPHIFLIYLLPTIYMIYLNSKIYSNDITINKIYESLAISILGALSWFLSEMICNDITKFGHVIWHFLFPLGFYKIVVYFDKKKIIN